MGKENIPDSKDGPQDSEAENVAVEANPTKAVRRLKPLLAMLMEWLATVVVVLIFFMFLLWGSTFILPEGSRLINLDDRDKTDARLSEGDSLLSSQRELSFVSSGDEFAAVLSEVHKTVKHKSAQGISWLDALKGMQLYDQDAVKTSSASYAVINFDDVNKLQLGPDSLVIVRSMDDDPWFHERRSGLIIVEGELRGTMVDRLAKNSASVEVMIPGGVARILRKKGSDEPVDYEIKVKPDQSATVAVYRGVAEVVAQDKTVKLGANQVTVVVKGAPPTKPTVMPDDAKIISPVDTAAAYYRDFPQEITFSWKKTKEQRYRLMIARDVLFADVVLDEIVTTNEFIHGDLHHGSYFWRVASVGVDGSEGKLSQTHRIKIIQDMQPPRLQVNYPKNAIATDSYLLNGSVEPGATLIIDGVQVNTDGQGRFEVEVKLKKGMNLVVAQAVDAAGNTSFVSEFVNRDF